MNKDNLSFVSAEVDAYCIEHSNRASRVLGELELHTRANVPASIMLTGPLEGALLGFLCRLVRAKRVLEFGTYTGYSALSMAEALPSDGAVVTLDIDEKNGQTARAYWEKSPHGNKIELRLGLASETAKTLIGPFDLVFIDADKPGYREYLDIALEFLSPNGLIVVDNCLYSGEVLNGAARSTNGQAMSEFNERVLNDPTLDRVLLPVRDGIYLIRRR